MAKAKQRPHQPPQKHAPQPVPPAQRPPLDLAVVGLAVIGMLLTGYLTVNSWMNAHPAFCAEGSGCDIVQSSRWSTFLGIPMALWGCATYGLLAYVVWNEPRARTSPLWPLGIAMCGFAISAYLTMVSVVEIGATCPYCLASFGIIATIMLLTILRKPPNLGASLTETAIIALLLVGLLHLHYSGVFDPASGPEDPRLKRLAIHLTQSGAKMYGTFWCPKCQQQKTVFEASATRLPYVECSSGGRGSPLTPACAAENIRGYPTWIIDGKRLVGLQTPESLASASGFRWRD